MPNDFIDWPGQSGKTYRYWFLNSPKIAQNIKAEGGNYAFVKRSANGNFVPLYFGQADDLQARIPSHERWDDASRIGATHVMSHTTPAGEQARLTEERDLIQRWNPVLNIQHRKLS
jgi:excinuclease UvrABC nuclease subunit